MHMVPSHVPLPCLLTIPGIEAVFISSILFKKPSGVLNPTIIFGTPSKNDWIQNFINLRSRVTISLSFRISAVVFSSTQLIGESSTGLQSHTESNQRGSSKCFDNLTCIHFTTNYYGRATNTRLDDRAILGIIVDYLILTVLDVFSRSFGPCGW